MGPERHMAWVFWSIMYFVIFGGFPMQSAALLTLLSCSPFYQPVQVLILEMHWLTTFMHFRHGTHYMGCHGPWPEQKWQPPSMEQQHLHHPLPRRQNETLSPHISLLSYAIVSTFLFPLMLLLMLASRQPFGQQHILASLLFQTSLPLTQLSILSVVMYILQRIVRVTRSRFSLHHEQSLLPMVRIYIGLNRMVAVTQRLHLITVRATLWLSTTLRFLQGGSKEKTLRTSQAKGDYIRNRVHSNQQQITEER